MSWLELGTNDTIEDSYDSTGATKVVVKHGTDTYETTNENVIKGAEKAKAARASGGSSVTVSITVDETSGALTGIKYSVAI